jgi:hypothetical protein
MTMLDTRFIWCRQLLVIAFAIAGSGQRFPRLVAIRLARSGVEHQPLVASLEIEQAGE